jgi:hypothetical protein
MIRRALILSALALLVLPGATAAQDRGISVTGSGDADVKPQNAKDNASIVAAVDAARTTAARAALDDARKQAERLAAAAGVKLGAVVAISEVQPDSFGLPGIPFPARPPVRGRAVPVPALPVQAAPVPFGPLQLSPFGKDRYCANVRRPVFRRKDGRRRRTGSRQVRSCIVPGRVTTQVEVTFAIG